MKSAEFVDLLKGMGMRVFTSLDAARVLGKDEKYVSLFLGRLSNRGSIRRIEGGKFYIPGTSIYAVASNVVYPSYIGLLSAFRYHNLTTQIIASVDVISIKRHPELAGIEDHNIRFIAIGRSRFFGFYMDRDTGAFVAHIEKAIVDSLYFQEPPLPYVEEAIAAAKEEGRLDTERLVQFAVRMKSGVVMKRLRGLCRSAGLEWSGLEVG